MEKPIGATLKNARKDAGLSVKDVRQMLLKNNIDVAEKTIYGWENDFCYPNIKTFLLLCNLYGMKDVLVTFGYREQCNDLCFYENEYSKEELSDIQKYAEFLKTKRSE